MERNPDSFELMYYNPYDHYEYTQAMHFDTRDYSERVWKAVRERNGQSAVITVAMGTRFGKLTNDITQLHSQIQRELEEAKHDPTAYPICQVKECWSRPDDIRFTSRTEWHVFVLYRGKWMATKENNLFNFPVVTKEEFQSTLEGEPDLDWAFN